MKIYFRIDLFPQINLFFSQRMPPVLEVVGTEKRKEKGPGRQKWK